MKNKCAYLHKDNEGIVRYVGSGSVARASLTHANSNRGKDYKDFVNANGKFKVEIVAESLTKLEAEDLERELYDKYEATILNCTRPTSEVTLTKEMFENYLFYDETSKSCLRWKVNGSGRGGNNIRVNNEAGGLDRSRGYYVVKLNYKSYYIHRIILVLHCVDIRGKVVDHIDRNKENNKISNLRAVTQQENCNNKSLSLNNTSGVQGVSFHKQNYWTVSWYENYKLKIKHFPISKYESINAAFDAAVAYRQQMVKLHYT